MLYGKHLPAQLTNVYTACLLVFPCAFLFDSSFYVCFNCVLNGEFVVVYCVWYVLCCCLHGVIKHDDDDDDFKPFVDQSSRNFGTMHGTPCTFQRPCRIVYHDSFRKYSPFIEIRSLVSRGLKNILWLSSTLVEESHYVLPLYFVLLLFSNANLYLRGS